MIRIRWTPRPVILTIRNNKDNIRVLLYSYYTHHYREGDPPKATRFAQRMSWGSEAEGCEGLGFRASKH